METTRSPLAHLKNAAGSAAWNAGRPAQVPMIGLTYVGATDRAADAAWAAWEAAGRPMQLILFTDKGKEARAN